MSADYHSDIIALRDQQAALLRTGRLDELDIEHLAEEIEDELSCICLRTECRDRLRSAQGSTFQNLFMDLV